MQRARATPCMGIPNLVGDRESQEVGIYPSVGLEQASMSEVLRSAALLGVGHLAVA